MSFRADAAPLALMPAITLRFLLMTLFIDVASLMPPADAMPPGLILLRYRSCFIKGHVAESCSFVASISLLDYQ